MYSSSKTDQRCYEKIFNYKKVDECFYQSAGFESKEHAIQHLTNQGLNKYEFQDRFQLFNYLIMNEDINYVLIPAQTTGMTILLTLLNQSYPLDVNRTEYLDIINNNICILNPQDMINYCLDDTIEEAFLISYLESKKPIKDQVNYRHYLETLIMFKEGLIDLAELTNF